MNHRKVSLDALESANSSRVVIYLKKNVTKQMKKKSQEGKQCCSMLCIILEKVSRCRDMCREVGQRVLFGFRYLRKVGRRNGTYLRRKSE